MTTDATTVTAKGYVRGFLLSLLLTFISYFMVTEQWLTGWDLAIAVMSFALIQVFVQLFYFLHMGVEAKPRVNLHIFLFMALVLVIIVIGTLWIMKNLNDRVMPPMDLMHQTGM
jgi:cytochrome o ubiquinol oxidase operon protein cyoD